MAILNVDKKSHLFLRTAAFASIVFAAGVAAFNVMLDPYLVIGTPRVTGFNERKPAVELQEPLMKAYEVLRAAPNTLLLGNSRVGTGLDAQSSVWPERDRPIYNLGVVGAAPYVSYRYLQHAMSMHHPNLVLLAVDFEYFLTVADVGHPENPEFESRFAVTRNGAANPDRSKEHMRNLRNEVFSLDGMTDSVMTLAANLGVMSVRPSVERVASEGTYPSVALIDIFTIKGWRNKEINKFAMADVQAILDLCESRGTDVILMINPTHADQLELLDLMGYWQKFEDWKRELLTLAARYPRMNGGSGIPLWDFTGYDSYSTEAVLPARHIMRWFRDSRHYTKALGDVVVKRIFNRSEEDFGVLLNAENIESHFVAIREQQHRYREDHLADMRRVRDLYDLVNGMQSQATAQVRNQ